MIKFHPMRISTGSADEEAVLVLTNRGLAAVLVRLSPAIHDEDIAGRWFLEAAFAPSAAHAPIFDTLQSADRWFEERLSSPPAPTPSRQGRRP